ncbi:MAG: amino acid synthesis family protein [Kordiimonadaceae bacterium]|nr:amino acid synthesis family protein [Kordiimonadaceae bacterium]
MQIVKTFSFIEETEVEAGIKSSKPLRKVAVVAIVENPFSGKPYQEDLTSMIDASPAIGTRIASEAARLLGEPVESYGKGAVVGTAGEQEHGVALLTTVYGNAFRDAVGGGSAWISSATKIGGPGTSLDIPLAYKDALFVRSHYDAFSITLHTAPLPNQIAIICAVASRGRLNDRVGGISADEAEGKDGLR